MTHIAQDVLRKAVARLRDVKGDGAMRDARILLASVLNCPKERLILVLSDQLSKEQETHFEQMITARMDHQPVSQIIGEREFWGRHFLVTPDVLDPRPETETLVQAALKSGPCERILDLGTGSGCIVLSLLAQWPNARAVAVDVSPKSIAVAMENADRLGVSDRVEFIVSDWFTNVTGTYDLVVSNPPYISNNDMQALAPEIRKWEPETALLGGGDGLDAYRVIATTVASYLTPTGQSLLEFGKGQSTDVAQIFTQAGFPVQRILRDMNDHDRVIWFSAENIQKSA